ncbi:pentapeptide repeat-containing protein [Amycolatopsis sp. NPDC005961]|uniref:pentapeptide repeat-containing protein n=1 Tax=Amycolatopsis sp. NPDC005961 TaxID=3156720 RepID=UPI003402A419
MTRWQRARWFGLAAGLAGLLGAGLLAGWFDLVDWPAAARWARPLAPGLALIIVALLFVAVGAWRALKEPSGRMRSPGLSWWVVVTAAAVVLVAVVGATHWLLSEADHANDRAAARVEAIKTGLGVGAGTAGIFALLLAVRRQIHQEHTAADVNLDAAEKRVTELYTKAADQLGSRNAAVRLAGLYALERLGKSHESQQETILNVVCAYLRMPYTPGETPTSDATPDELDRHEQNLQEAQVRLTAQRILRDHLLYGPEADGYWAGVVDLTGANIAGIDLEDTDLRWARLNGALLSRALFADADLSHASLVGADLSHANLSGADLSGADLTGADLRHANLDRADLEDTTVTRADFTDARLPAGTEIRNGLIIRA